MRRVLLAAFLILPLAATPALLPSPSPCKPTPPINLEARIVGDPYAPFSIEAHAASRTGHEVELEIILPEGVAHVAGERRARGRRSELRVDVRAPGPARREIFVRATIREGDAKLTRVVPLVVNDAPAAPKGTLKTNSRGEAILEFGP